MKKKGFKNNIKYLNSLDNKTLIQKLKNIILTTSDGFDLPFLQYTQLGIGNLILTYLYALYIKSYKKNLQIIPFYPIRVIPIIKDFKYWYLRSSFEFNYKITHIKRFLYFCLLGKTFKGSFINKKDLFLSTHINNVDTKSFEKISSLNLIYIKKHCIIFKF